MAKAKKKSIFESPLLSTKVKSANVKLFPEAAFGYLLGPIMALISNSIVNAYLTQYWDKVLGLKDWANAFMWILPLASVVIIIIGNLLVGKLMDKSKSRAGKARPFLLAGLPLIALALIALFLAPFPENATAQSPNILTLVVIALGYNLYYAIAYPFYYTSHSALVNLSTRNSGARGLLATASNGAMVAAAGLGGMVGPFLIDLLGLLPKEGATQAERAAANGKWTILMIVLIVALILGCLLEYYFTRERITEESFTLAGREEGEAAQSESKAKKVSTSAQLKICVKDKYWWFVVLFFILYQLGGMLKNNGATWYAQAFDNGNVAFAGTVNIIGAVPTALGMILITPIAAKFGKARSILVGSILAVVGAALGFLPLTMNFAQGGQAVAIAAFIVKAIGTIPAMYISLALLSDVLDHQEAMTGVRTDGFTMAVYGSIMIAMTGIANAIILAANSAATTEEAKRLINTIIFFGGEGICCLAIAAMFIFMNVEKFSKLDHLAIVVDQKAKAKAAGEEWIDPVKKMELEEAEEAKKSEAARIAELKAKCEKSGKSFEAEEAAYQAAKAEKEKAAAAKKAAAEEKKAQKAKEAEEKYNALSDEAKAALKAKQDAKAEKQRVYDEKVASEFRKMREATWSIRKENVPTENLDLQA
jgi:GPH family glycoside/pentoside/hexuronide:cation symporter